MKLVKALSFLLLAAIVIPCDLVSGKSFLIFLQRHKNGNHVMYTSDTRGKKIEKITSEDYDSWLPKISPRGDKIAFISDRDHAEKYCVWVIDLDDDNARQVSDMSTASAVLRRGDVSWSPDGRELIFTSEKTLYRIKLDGSDLRIIVTHPTDYFHWCEWAPRGGKIAVWSYSKRNLLNMSINILNVDGSDMKILVPDRKGGTHNGSFSPDGKKLAYFHDVSGYEHGGGGVLRMGHIIIHNIANGKEKDITRDPDRRCINPRWSHDGKKIIYGYNYDPHESNRYTVAIMNSKDGKRSKKIIKNGIQPDWWGKFECTTDFNFDGNIDIRDVVYMMNKLKADADISPEELECLDLNHDGDFDAADIIVLQLEIMKSEPRQPPPVSPFSTTTAGLAAGAGSHGKLTVDEIAAIERMLARIELTPELKKAFQAYLYGEPGDIAAPQLPAAFSIAANRPNPFNPSTCICYSVPDTYQSVRVSLKVFDLRGRLVRTLVNDLRHPGTHSVFWDGTDEGGRKLSSGIYLYRMKAGKFVRSRKMVLIK
ncbi:MAG: FlgD immunoglobulin-like domain containing protein, partial [Gemmatimonadota bacterium]|nr:FlgD immunoglobulin-like domain containing protein [Gemmatimonadota bacterium]